LKKGYHTFFEITTLFSGKFTSNILFFLKQTKNESKRGGGDAKMAMVPGAKEALQRFKMEAASEVGVPLKQGYNGDLTSRQAGSIGGQMVKKMVESYENSIKNSK
jgi:hypothetical protein